MFGLPNIAFKPSLIGPLQRHPWPGNVREPRNVFSKLLVLHTWGVR